MTAFVASTTVNVLRGNGTDEFGDETDRLTTVSFDNPASVTEQPGQRQGLGMADDKRNTNYEPYLIRMRSNVDVREGDRLYDNRTRRLFVVREIFDPQSIVGAADLRVEALRIS